MRVLLLFLFLLSCIHADPIEISRSDRLSVLENSSICIVDNTKTLQEIIEQDSFVENDETYLLEGLTTDVIWVRFTLKNITEKRIDRVLVLTSPLLEEALLFKGRIDRPVAKGLAHMTSEEKTLFPSFRISLDTKSSQEYFLRVKNDYHPIGFALEIQDEIAFKSNDLNRQIYYIVLITIIFVLLSISILMLSTNRWAYTFYSLYLLAFIATQASYMGLTKIYIAPDLAIVDARAMIIKISLLISTFALFSKHFLSTSGKVDLFYKTIIAVSILEVLVMYLFPSTYSMVLMVLTGAIFIITNLAIGIYIWLTRKNESAKYFVIGYFVASLCYIVVIVNILGIASFLSSHHEIILVGTIVEAFIFLFAFGHYNRISKLERNIDELQKEKKVIEEKVQEKMKDVSTDDRLTIYDECHYLLDTKELMLNGTIKHLLPKQRILLELLLAHRNRVVTYEEIGSEVWEGSGYTNKAISELISTLRSTFENRRIIKNRSGMGYILEIQ